MFENMFEKLLNKKKGDNAPEKGQQRCYCPTKCKIF